MQAPVHALMNYHVLGLVYQKAMQTFPGDGQRFHFQCDKDIVHNCVAQHFELLKERPRFDRLLCWKINSNYFD